MLRFVIIILTFCLSSTLLIAQYLNTTKFTKDDLQLYGGIVGMHEDDVGYLWVYGFDGISRYDGFSFEPIKKVYPESENLISLNCSSLTSDQYHLWIGTRSNGLFAIDKEGQLKNFQDLKANKEGDLVQNVLQVISSGDKLFLRGKAGLEAYVRVNSQYEKLIIPNLDATSVVKIFMHKDMLWIENDNGLHQLNLAQISKIQYSELRQLSFFVHPSKSLWIASIGENGTTLHEFDEKSSRLNPADFQPYKNYKKVRGYSWLNDESLFSTPFDLFPQIVHFNTESIERIDPLLSHLGQERFIRQPFTDSKGRTWIFGQELYLAPASPFIELHALSKKVGVVIDMLVTERYTYLSIANKGLYKYNNDGKFLASYSTSNSELADNYISDITQLNDGKIGLCMMNHFQIMSEQVDFEKPFVLPGIIRSVIEDEESIWLGGFSHFFKLSKSNRQVEKIPVPNNSASGGNAVNAFISVDNNTLRFAAAHEGILTYRINEKEIDLSELMSQALSKQARSPNVKTKINHASISPSGSKILSATDNGLFLIDNIPASTSDEKLERMASQLSSAEDRIKLNTSERFFTNAIFFSDSIAYATSRKRIYRISLSDLEVESFGRSQGTVNNTYSLRSNYKDLSGNIYFGGDQGVDVVHEELYQEGSRFSKLELGQVYFNGIPQHALPAGKLSIPSDIKVAEFKVNMPKNRLDDQVIIQGRLDKNEWTDFSADHKMTLYNPSPGNHQMDFRARNLHGKVMSESTNVKFHVKRKWYEHLWLWLVLGFFLISGIMWGILNVQKKRSKRELAASRLQEELASLKLTSLNSQMNPHFMTTFPSSQNY